MVFDEDRRPCPYCREEISENARICPYCRSDVDNRGEPDWPDYVYELEKIRKRKFRFKLVLSIVALLFLAWVHTVK